MNTLSDLTAIVATFFLSVALTYAVRAAARRWGIVARPKADRWHTTPTALMGGVAIAATTLIAALTFVPQTAMSWTVLGASSLMFVIGIVDDLVSLKPYQKVIGQLIAASIVVGVDMILPWTAYYPVNVLITMFWLVGITNAVNLLDNMDGLAAGVSAVAAVFLGLQFALNADAGSDYALMLALFTASLVGFLVYNHNPASIFMGDCGSLFIGFFLASSALLTNQASRSRSFLPVLAVPVLVLFIPIFDTTLVFILRKMAGRSVSQGGRDHTSHRLVALGLSERKAVWMLWALAVVSGVMGLAILRLPPEAGFAALFFFSLTLIYLGIHLGKVKVYDVSQPTPVLSFLVDVSHKRRIFEVLLDSSLIVFAYYLAFTMVLGPLESSAHANTFFRSLPLVVGLKLAAFTAAGVYRGMWRYITPDALWIYFRGSLLGSMSSVVALTLVFRFQGFSRAVFVLDGFLLLFLLILSRYGFRLIRKLFPQTGMQRECKPVLIYGAGDAGEILARELMNNPRWRMRPVGFLDDNPQKTGRTLHGLRVMGGLNKLAELSARGDFTGVILSSRRFRPEKLAQIRETCEQADLELYQLSLAITPLLSHDDTEEPIRYDSFDEIPIVPSANGEMPNHTSVDNLGQPTHAGA
jgi:UDP-GlcNAc:undecaprenyl-phosphate GlcNAc-1-phosphate transferase